MPIYEYVCKDCGEDCSVTSTHKELMDRYIKEGYTHRCGGSIKRVFSFSVARPMQPHYNKSAGQYISFERQLKDIFKVQSEQATERTGVEHNFVPVHPSERDRLGVTSEGLAATYDRRKALGMPIPDVIRPGKLKD